MAGLSSGSSCPSCIWKLGMNTASRAAVLPKVAASAMWPTRRSCARFAACQQVSRFCWWACLCSGNMSSGGEGEVAIGSSISSASETTRCRQNSVWPQYSRAQRLLTPTMAGLRGARVGGGRRMEVRGGQRQTGQGGCDRCQHAMRRPAHPKRVPASKNTRCSTSSGKSSMLQRGCSKLGSAACRRQRRAATTEQLQAAWDVGAGCLDQLTRGLMPLWNPWRAAPSLEGVPEGGVREQAAGQPCKLFDDNRAGEASVGGGSPNHWHRRHHRGSGLSAAPALGLYTRVFSASAASVGCVQCFHSL